MLAIVGQSEMCLYPQQKQNKIKLNTNCSLKIFPSKSNSLLIRTFGENSSFGVRRYLFSNWYQQYRLQGNYVMIVGR